MNLSAYDDAALEALAPKGLVRRARRDQEAGLAEIAERSEKAAVVRAEDQTVAIDPRGPAHARCTCPAGGICRHILLAVMTLNASSPEPPEATTTTDAPTAAQEVCALPQPALVKFAGADWKAAVALAAASADSPIVETGRNCAVELAGAPTGVTFIAGLGLKGAAFKGPKSRARVVVAACAILLRARHGIVLEAGAGDSAEEEPSGIAQSYLADAAAKLAQCTRSVLAGASPLAADTLFDLAISARAEAAPRLTARLRGLSKQAGYAASRDIHFEPDMFLSDAAQTLGLIEALKSNPRDPVLTGSLKRDYRPCAAFEIWMLGAAHWRTQTGARGLTLHGIAPEEGAWRSVSLARGPGQDPTFDPRSAYTMPLWGAGTAQALLGNTLLLREPLLADDGALAPTLPQPAAVQGAIQNLSVLIERGAAMTHWAALRSDLSSRLSAGLRRRASPLACLLAPAGYGALAFDDFAQTYEWEAFDQGGESVLLSLPGEEHELARRLANQGVRRHLLLVETLPASREAALRPIAILFDGASGLEIVNFTLDQWRRQGAIAAAFETAQSLIARKAPSPMRAPPPLAELARRALDSAVATCTGTPGADRAALSSACEAAGLVALANAVERMHERGDPLSSLAVAYLASEAAAGLTWS